MGKIVVSQNLSLDGVVEDPTGEDGFRHGGWFNEMGESDREGWGRAALEEALGTEALLFGRRGYEFFAARWPSRTGDLADRLNDLPKYVISSTLKEPSWSNTTVLTDDVVDAVAKLRDHTAGEIVVFGSRQLVQALIENDLVDKLRLMIFPVVLGAGKRLFAEASDRKSMRLVGVRTIGDGLAHLTYGLDRDA